MSYTFTGRLVNSHTSNTYINTDNIVSDYDSSQTTKPIAAYSMLTGRPYKNKQQSLRVGLRTRQDRHTCTEDKHLERSLPALLAQPLLQSVYTHAQIYSQHEIP